MFGRPIGYKALSNRIESLWGLTCEYRIVDLDNSYFLVKIASLTDYNRILMGGPWMIYGHYLVVQPWSRDFSTEETLPSKIIDCIRLPALHYRYYTKGLIRALASAIGTVIKVGYDTNEGRRGKFARIAMVVDMSKPLVPFLGIDGKKQSIVYEGLPSICYECGKVGHIKEKCDRLSSRSNLKSTTNVMGEVMVPPSVEMESTMTTNSEEQDTYGSWM